MQDMFACNLFRWLVNVTLSIDDRVDSVVSQFVSEPRLAHVYSTVKPTIYRLQEILVRLSRGEKVTADLLAKQMEVSIRTVTRDLDYLINELHVPIAYVPKKRSYVLTGAIPIVMSVLSQKSNMSPDEDAYEVVVLEADLTLVRQLRKDRFHPSQQIYTDETGMPVIKLVLKINNTLVNRIAGFGNKIRVRAPDSLRERVSMRTEEGHPDM